MTDGLLVEVLTMTRGSATTAALSAAETTIPVEDITDFDATGGQVEIADVVYDYTAIDEDALTITLASGLTDAVAEFEPVLVRVGNRVAVDYYAEVHQDEGEGEPILVPLRRREVRLAWPVGVYDPPLPVDLAPDLSAISAADGAPPELDPAYIKTGKLDVGTVLTVGTTDGQRVVISGADLIQAYDTANQLSVNIDGEENFMRGTFATDADDQARVEIGQGETWSHPSQEVRLYTGSTEEVEPAELTVFTTTHAGDDVGVTRVTAPKLDAAASSSSLSLQAGISTGSQASLSAQVASLLGSAATLQVGTDISLQLFGGAASVFGGLLDATLGDGGVGTGTFRDSVDARVTALAALISHTHAIADTTGLQAALDALKPVTGGNAAFNSAANAVNTTGKYEGRPGYNTVSDRPIWATGSGTTATWVYADGTTAHTPV